MDTRAMAEREVVELHEFFVEWFNGSCPGDDATFEERFASHLSDGLVYVMPGGESFTRARLVSALRPAHGSNPDFRIEVEDVQVRFEDAGSLLVSYAEQQHGAKNSARASNRRLSSVLFLRDGDALRWHHLQETWAPDSQP